jgi:hypothetical protein
MDVDMYGDVAITGIPGSDYHRGHTAIWVRNTSGFWTRTATLVASDAKPGAEFGRRVALLDGRAVVASYTAIYLFVRQPSGEWVQKDEHTFAGAAEVSDLDWQGNLLAVGVRGDTYPNYAFAYDSSQTNVLRKIARFAPADAAKSDGFGTRIAAYGSTLVATAPGYNGGQGATYVYTCGASACTQAQKILAIDGKPGDSFGSAVDMNGTYLVIGASGFDQNPDWSGPQHGGASYIFTHSGNAWAQTQTLHPTSDEYANYNTFGADVTIQGSRLLVGAPYSSYPDFEGVAFEYVLSGGRWSARAVLQGIYGGQYESFGSSTSLIGQYAIVGEPSPTVSHPQSNVSFYKLP